jgi:Macrocin-O-methyltransferase (TylF)
MTRYALLHLDCDLYAPTRAGLEFFYPKLVRGGFLIIHDYMSFYWDGVEKAIDEFFANKPERFIPIPDKSGTICGKAIDRSEFVIRTRTAFKYFRDPVYTLVEPQDHSLGLQAQLDKRWLRRLLRNAAPNRQLPR